MFSEKELSIINQALSIIESKARTSDAITSPSIAANLCTTKLAHLEHEVFAVAFLDNQHRLISFDVLSIGTIDSASVYPREIVKAALKHNSAAVMLSHNHPSGAVEPSAADKRITTKLVEALSLVDVRVLDHIIVGTQGHYSFAEHGLI